MGKKKGKLFASIVGAFLGFTHPGWFGTGVKAWVGALYGASIGSTIWSAMHKPKMDSDYSRFDQYMNTVSSEAMIPVVYGERKYGGIQTWHKTENSNKRLIKDVVIAEGDIEGIYGVCANDLIINTASTSFFKVIMFKKDRLIKSNVAISPSHVFSILNIDYQNATVKVYKTNSPTPGDKVLSLYANGQRTNITLCNTVDIGHEGLQNYNGSIAALISYINSLGNGWRVLFPVPTSNSAEKILDLPETNCYNNPVSLQIKPVKDCYYAFHNRKTPDNWNSVGGYKNMAWLRATLNINEEMQSGNPTITCICRGKKILDTRTGEYEFSDNPAMIVRDFLLNKTYGCGKWITADMLDEDSFKAVADYCDEPIAYKDENGFIQYEKRYTLNIVLDQKKNAIEHLQDILANFGGFIVFCNNKIGLRVEKPEPISYNFTDAHIVRDSVSFQQTSLDDTPNKYIIKYIEPTQNWTNVSVLVEDTVDQRERGKIITKEIQLTGCTRQTQAKRLGNLYKHLNKLCSIVIQFQTTTFAMHLQPGDVITVTYKNLISNMPFRILEIQEDKGIWTIKAKQYNESIYDDSYLAEIEIKDYIPIPNALSDTIPEVSNIQLSQTYYKQKDGTIISDIIGICELPNYQFLRKINILYSIDNGNTWVNYGDNIDGSFVIHNAIVGKAYLIKCIVENTLGRKSEGIVSNPIYITGKDQPPSDVPNLTATIDSTDRTKIRLSWTAVDDVDLAGYRIMEGNTVIEPCYQGVGYIYTASVSKQYIFKIYAVDNSGNLSVNPATATLDVVVEPNTVTGFTGTIQETDRSKILFSWQPNNGQDISHYEIREGTNWNTSTVIASQLKATAYTHSLTSEGYKTFLIKAVNLAGKYSANASSYSLQVTLRPDAPTNFQAQQEPKDRSLLKLSWDASSGKDIAGYEIRKGTNWDTAEYVTFTRETTYWYSAQNSGSYNFMIKAKTVAGYLSNAANTSITVIIEPYDVTGFTAVQMIDNRTKVRLMWDPPISLDVAYFEIRKGVSWDAGQVIGQRVTGTFYDIIVPDETIQTFWIKAVSVAGNYSQNAATIEGIFNLNPAPVSNIQISQDPNDKSILNITWEATPESDLAFYEIRIGYTWETATKIGETKELRWTYRLTQTGDVKVIIKAKNAAEYYSDEAFNHYYAVLEPQDVTGFQVIQNGEYVEMYWDKATESDVVAYEIREGANFDSGSLVASGITLTEYKIKVDNERQYYYHIKAINRSLHYSLNATSAMVAVQNLPPKNIIQTYDEIALQSGTHSNTEFGQSLINWQTIGGKWSDYPNTKFSDVGGQMVLKLAKDDNGNYYTNGTYTCATKDMGQVITANITTDFRSSVILRGTGLAKLQMRLSRDNVAWTNWQDFRPAQYTFRYADFRVLLGTSDISKTPEVNHCEIRIDVSDVEKTGTITVPIGGTTVSYGHTFYTVPVITPTAIGNNKFPQVIAKTNTDFTVKIVDRNGNDVGGQLDWRVRGY